MSWIGGGSGCGTGKGWLGKGRLEGEAGGRGAAGFEGNGGGIGMDGVPTGRAGPADGIGGANWGVTDVCGSQLSGPVGKSIS